MHIELGLDSLRTPFSVTSVVPGLGQSKRTSGKRWRKQANPRCTGQCHSSPQHNHPKSIRHPRQLCTVFHCCRYWPLMWHRHFWPRSSCIYPIRFGRSFPSRCPVYPWHSFPRFHCRHSTWDQKLKWNSRSNETLARKLTCPMTSAVEELKLNFLFFIH